MNEPTTDDIERSWRRPRLMREPSPASPGHQWISAYLGWLERSTAFSILAFVVVSICFAASSLADSLLKLGWGFGWSGFWGSLGLAVWGVLVFGFCKVILSFVRAVHQRQSA